MSALTIPMSETPHSWRLPYRGKIAMGSLIIAESAIFTIFVVAYLFYVGKSLTGPTPNEVLHTPIFFTICLLSSSITVHVAGKFLEQGKSRAFLSLWFLTIVLGGLFLFGTGQEWQRLICEHGLTISTNLFGTTYYSLVGLHAFHVIVGATGLTIILILTVLGFVTRQLAERISVFAMYWHFVDAVWVVVLSVVYFITR